MVSVGDVYDITATHSRRWRGKYRVIAIEGHHALVERVGNRYRDTIETHLLETWPKVNAATDTPPQPD